MGQFGVMIGQLVGFLIMLMVGYGCVRLRFYGQTALDGMCSLLLNVLIPVLVFSNAVDGADRAQLASNWGVMLLTAVMYALLILVFWLVAEPALPTEPAPFTEPFTTAPRAPIALPPVVSSTGSHSHTPYVQSGVWSMIDISAT